MTNNDSVSTLNPSNSSQLSPHRGIAPFQRNPHAGCELDTSDEWNDDPKEYWVIRDGEPLLRTTDRLAVAQWIRENGTRGVKVLVPGQ